MADEIEFDVDTTDDWLAENVQKIASYKTLLIHRMTSDYEKREAVGVAPVLPD